MKFLVLCSKILFLLSILSYLFSFLLDNKNVKKSMLDIWYNLAKNNDPLILKDRVLEIITSLYLSIYEKNNKLSFKKLTAVVFILNISFVISMIEAVINTKSVLPIEEIAGHYHTHQVLDTEGLIFMAIFLTPSFYITEFMAYKISKTFFNKAFCKKSFLPILYNFSIIFLIFYLIPFALFLSIVGPPIFSIYLSISIIFFLLLVTPVGTLGFLFSAVVAQGANYQPGLYQVLLLAISSFSVFIPILLMLFFLIIIYNRFTLSAFLKIIEKTEVVNPYKIREISLGIITICSGIFAFF